MRLAFLRLTAALGTACLALGLLEGQALALAASEPPERALDWTVGTWKGVRRDGRDGSEFPMTMRVESVPGGFGQIRHLEVRHDGGVYRGLAVQVFDGELGRWVRQYVNATRRRFARLEGDVEGARSVWHSVGTARARESRLVSERLDSKHWRRTMSVSQDGGATWQILWIDDLEAQASPKKPAPPGPSSPVERR